MMKIILLGPPGSGKGTQAQKICEKYNIPLISTGNILRNAIKAQTSVGIAAKQIIDRGELVADDLIIGLVQQRLDEQDCARGYLLDGVPRTIEQAQMLRDLGIKIDYVLQLIVPTDLILERITGRRWHPGSGRNYHIKFNPPKHPNKDDITGEALVQRDDDKEETILNRLKIYEKKTAPVGNFYKNYPGIIYKVIDGVGMVDEVALRIEASLQK